MSVWELMILAEQGRLSLGMPVSDWIDEANRRTAIREAPLTFEISIESRSLRLPHQDPVDRFLAATAKLLDLTLVTSDRRLLASPEFRVLSNRKA